MSSRPPFNSDAQTKEELERSRTPDFIQLEIRGLKGGLGAERLNVEEQKLMDEYLALHRKVGNFHEEGYDTIN